MSVRCGHYIGLDDATRGRSTDLAVPPRGGATGPIPGRFVLASGLRTACVGPLNETGMNKCVRSRLR